MDWRYNQMWVTPQVVIGTYIKTVEILGVPIPVDPLLMQLPPLHLPPPQIVEQLVVQQSQVLAQHATPPPAPAVRLEAGQLIELNSWNAAQFAMQYGDILKECSATQWHQIIVKTPVPQSERRSVISAINKLIYPLRIVPYFFHMENIEFEHNNKHEYMIRMSFYVHLCDLALKELCERNLRVPYHDDKFPEIDLTIRLFNKEFNLLEALKVIVLRRLDIKNKFLDLSYINDIPEIRILLYDPADNWHILDKLLRIATLVAPGLTTLGLAGNGIESFVELGELLFYCNWTSLRTLDLSDNKIKSTSTIPAFHTVQISEVYLDHNPMCQILDKDSYVRMIKVDFPHLKKLDGTYLHTTPDLPYWKPNFIVNGTDDAGEFADQFIEHFFTLYDDSDRRKLRGLYHENAYFSLSCLYSDEQLATCDSRWFTYVCGTRNLLCCSDITKLRAALTHGSHNILSRLSYLPNTQHDPYTFTVDLTVHTPKVTVLTVSGVFCDMTEKKTTNRHFSRTFVLTAQQNDEYQITNDILHISNATAQEEEGAFQFAKLPKKIDQKQPPSELSEREKEYRTKTYQQLTNMSAYYSQKCLEDADWDLKKALQTFLELQERITIELDAIDKKLNQL